MHCNKLNVEVICISSEGLRSLASQREDGKFVDPFHRTEARFLTISNDFEAYVIHTEGASSSTNSIDSGMQAMQIAPSSDNDEIQRHNREDPGPSKIGAQATEDFMVSRNSFFNLLIFMMIIFTFIVIKFTLCTSQDTFKDDYIQLF